MKAYKSRSSSQLAYALDSIFNDRLYCADWQDLNDPMEGAFIYSYRSTNEPDLSNKVAEVVRQKKRIRVCSLSLTYNCHLLWAHYASGFDGLALEIDLPDDLSLIRKVQYRSVFGRIAFDGSTDLSQLAESILSSKIPRMGIRKGSQNSTTRRMVSSPRTCFEGNCRSSYESGTI